MIQTAKLGAQRLSASQRWASSNPDPEIAHGTGVLNAFRHHRGGHRLGFGGLIRVSRCSTPFGITEVGIGAQPAVDQQNTVLNAFRHHRGGHR